ncbi:hypothetical protein ACQPU1_17905 [Clostridium paraputrificum]|uniref:hypothetical protein n=1 Tax=Clostridium TaxID=1485 RepID=UPI003D34861A
MKYILFLALILAIFCLLFYFDRKQSILRQQLLVANSQNSSLRSKLSKYTKKKETIQIRYLHPNNPMGIIKEGSNILASPLYDSFLLHKSNVKMEVRILDKAEVLRETWYYIALPIDSNINSRGWIKQSDFSLFYDNSKNITKSF